MSNQPKIKVVCLTPFSLCVEGGRHLHPGEIADVDDTPAVRHDIDMGRLGEISVKDKPAETQTEERKPSRDRKVPEISEEKE